MPAGLFTGFSSLIGMAGVSGNFVMVLVAIEATEVVHWSLLCMDV